VRLLLVNDDGFEAAGLATLARAVGAVHEVWIVAPESERSGASNAITLKDSIRVREVGPRTYSCRGTPADCVLVALLGLVPDPVDLVLSGINHGPNLGTDILYSGTAGGARQATLMGRAGVALSVNAYAPPYDFQSAADFALRNLETFRTLADEDHFVNVNFPNTDCSRAQPMITFPSRRIYRDELKTYTAPNRDLFCFIGGPLPDARLEEGSDCDAVTRGFISITPVHVHPAYHDPIEERYREAAFR
jgi:5'-nucleotidase